MKLYTIILAAGLLTGCTNNPPSPSTPKGAEKQNDQNLSSDQAKKDAEFLVKLADANMLEIEMGKLVRINGQSAEVKNFGNMMINDHGKMLAELKTLASSKNITLPSDLCDDSKDALNDLSKKHGKEFDEAYVHEMLSDHKKDIKTVEDKIEDEKCDPDIKSYLQQGLPVLKHHMNTITQIKESEL